MTCRAAFSLVLAGVAGAFSGTQGTAPATPDQRPPVTFWVQVNRRHRDGPRGAVVPGLTQDDFQVIEEGQPYEPGLTVPRARSTSKKKGRRLRRAAAPKHLQPVQAG
ncbi:MAG TPA: hypothetical protein VML55_06910 [Planctomycetaceae bacterium]|nr:hypothetical protein [Planctomycetaceae bacterium]